MVDAAGNAKADALLIAWDGTEEGCLVVVVERATDGVAHVVAEGSYAVELTGVGLHGEFLSRIGARACAPSLAIHIYVWVYLVEGLAYEVHGLYVVNAHEVEAEAVDMVFPCPVEHGLYHELPHERFLAGGLVATAGAIGYLAFLCGTVVVAGVGEVEVAAIDVERVVVDNIEDDADAGLVKGLHHLLELPDAGHGGGGIGGVGAFGNVVVQRVVAPVVLRCVGLGLVDGGIVE